ncbi:MAG: hypothetical protein ACUVTG_09215 [Candidatus Oleimicrobiaceae bacterium]
MSLGCLVQEVSLLGPVGPLPPMLRVEAVIHQGRRTTFGGEQYRLPSRGVGLGFIHGGAENAPSGKAEGRKARGCTVGAAVSGLGVSRQGRKGNVRRAVCTEGEGDQAY